MNKTQQGIALIETLLIVLIIVIIGFGGYYVWHTQKQTDKANSNTVKASQSTPVASNSSSTKYLTINEWGVRAPYDGKLHLEYGINSDGNSANFSSVELDSSDVNCKTDLTTNGFGGSLVRQKETDEFFLADGTDSGMTVAKYASTQTASDYGHVGNYYYFFRHSQAVCSDSSSSQAIQSDTNTAIAGLAHSLQALPQ